MLQTQVEADSESPPKTPLWVKVFGIIVIVLILLVGIVHLTGHSPMIHMQHTQQGVHQP